MATPVQTSAITVPFAAWRSMKRIMSCWCAHTASMSSPIAGMKIKSVSPIWEMDLSGVSRMPPSN